MKVDTGLHYLRVPTVLSALLTWTRASLPRRVASCSACTAQTALAWMRLSCMAALLG